MAGTILLFITLKLNSIAGHILRRIVGSTAILLCLLATSGAYAQKYTFAHYDIENGLIQSQVNTVYQDNSHRLWMGTLGGACRFDGMDYYAISRSTGLINNFVYVVFCDKSGTIWFGTNRGLANFKNDKLYSFTLPHGIRSGWVTNLKQDAAGTIWGIMDGHLFKIAGNQIVLVKVAGLDNSITTMAVNKYGQLYVGVHQTGVYRLSGSAWQRIAAFEAGKNQIYMARMVFDKQQPDKLYIQSYKNLFTVQNGFISPYQEELLKDLHRPFLSVEIDATNKLWIGTGSGAYCLDKDKVIYFGEHNGFSDASVSDIYNDKDNNLWLATQGNGLYRYDGDDYIIYDQTEHMAQNPIIMGIAQDNKQNALLAIDGGGIGVYDGKVIKTVLLPSTMPNSRRVVALYKDRSGIVWVGTSLGGMWKYDGKQYTMIAGTEGNSINCITQDAEGFIWLATPRGTYYYDNQNVMHSTGMTGFASSLLPIGRDTMLVGTQEGLGLVVNRKAVPKFKLNLVGTSAILCMLAYKNVVIIGTDDGGVFAWDRITNKIRNYQVQDGLKANSIYSLATDENGLIWVGTGRGVSRFKLNERNLDINIINGNETKNRIIESNQNAILYTDHKILVGTTKGLSVYNTTSSAIPSAAPYIIINQIKLLSTDNSKANLLGDPASGNRAVLSAGQNHLSFSFLGVYLKNPETISYQYKLTGLEDKFCSPVQNNVVDYPSLPPGKYTFEVRAVSGEGVVSKNTASFSFEITPPFYRTYIFQLGVILVLIFTGVMVQNFIHHSKLQRLSALEAMKREEKLKIRQQTAEDFHDDLGNKLTRITVLSDILDAKLEKDKAEQRNLVMQIKQNAAALYNGTRDILWAMDPKSDNMFEVLNHIRDTGIEIFQDTEINFEFQGISDEQAAIKLPMEYSRNITMIFKELLNNILKHADSKNVKVTFSQTDKGEAMLRATDDGIGFDTAIANRGHGLNNVRARAKRIGGQLAFTSVKEKGTAAELLFKIYKKA